MTSSTQKPNGRSGRPQILAGYGRAVLRDAGLNGREREFRRGDTICFAGQARDAAWIVESGWVRVLLPSADGETTAEILGPGDLFGCPGCSSKVFTCTVVALTAVRATGYPALNLERFLHARPDAVRRLTEMMGVRVQEVAFLKSVGEERADRRIPLVLEWLRKKFGDDMPVTRELLADLCGLRRETCSRSLGGLKRKGILALASGRIQMLRPAAAAPAPR